MEKEIMEKEIIDLAKKGADNAIESIKDASRALVKHWKPALFILVVLKGTRALIKRSK